MSADSIDRLLGGFLSPVEVLVLAAIIALVSGYLGSYLAERGRSRATRDDFDEVKRRLEESTEVSSRVEAMVSRGLWVEQQRWEFRHRVYLRLIELLASARTTLHEVWKLELEDPPTHDLSDDAKEKRLQELFGESSRLKEAVKQELDLRGRLFLSAAALEAIERYLDAEELRILSIQREIASGPGQAAMVTSWHLHLESEVTAAWKAYEEIVAAAKRDLLLERELAPGA